jgi:hypothetical protein
LKLKVRFELAVTVCLFSTGLLNGQTSGGPIYNNGIQRVLVISVDGMHSLDFLNCSKGVNGGAPYCPNLASLAQTGVYYPNASSTKPSDSFPTSAGLATGGTPRTTGFYYDVSYDRSLSPPFYTTPYGIVGGAALCPGTVGTQVGFDEEIDNDLTKLDGGGGINPNYLPRDPKNACAPVYPHSFIRVNTMFEVVKATGRYTAWSDKHPAYDFYQGPSGQGVSDFYSPEINSMVVGLPTVPGCTSVVDTAADLTAWTNSFQNIQCYDSLKVQTVINWIDGLWHDGSRQVQVPALFGMNFQAVSVGQKLVENGVTGGYTDSTGTPSASLLSEIKFVDTSIGRMITELKNQGLYDSTLFVITAKHGQSPINPANVNRIPKDNPAMKAPSSVLGSVVAAASEDDVSLIWLNDQTKTASAVKTLSSSLATIGGGQLISGAAMTGLFADPAVDPRVPDIILVPNLGTVYTGGGKKISEHGGFSSDATNVILLVSNSQLTKATIGVAVTTTQIAPTVVNMLRIPPTQLQAVAAEGTQILPGLGTINPFPH